MVAAAHKGRSVRSRHNHVPLHFCPWKPHHLARPAVGPTLSATSSTSTSTTEANDDPITTDGQYIGVGTFMDPQDNAPYMAKRNSLKLLVNSLHFAYPQKKKSFSHLTSNYLILKHCPAATDTAWFLVRSTPDQGVLKNDICPKVTEFKDDPRLVSGSVGSATEIALFLAFGSRRLRTSIFGAIYQLISEGNLVIEEHYGLVRQR